MRRSQIRYKQLTKVFKIFVSSIFKTASSCLFFLPFLGIPACQTNDYQTTPAFYHWKTSLKIAPTEKNYLDSLNIQKVYAKFFDVDWDFNQQAAVAKASILIDENIPPILQIIPTVFITNRTLVQLPSDKLTDLADKISEKIKQHIKELPNQQLTEIQFDCDWTQSTRSSYFALLNLLKNHFSKKDIILSTTIRLHQIKYADKTGVPPVERGMLMYYNMGNVQDITTENSILDNRIGRQYIANLADYSLPLDVALPLFQWGVLFRNDKMIKLLNQLTAIDLVDKERFRQIDSTHWEVLKSTYLDGVYLYKNDEIRLEKVSFTALKAAFQLLQQYLKKENRTVVFYHLDKTVLEPFSVRELREVVLFR